MRQFLKSILFVNVMIIISCSDSSFISKVSKTKDKVEDKEKVTSDPIEDKKENLDPESFKTVIENSIDGSSDSIFTDKNGVILEKFNFSSSPVSPLVDYVIVYDNSSSMGAIKEKTKKGFDSLAKLNVFPKKSRLAVMTTMVSEENDYFKTHPRIARYVGIDKEPGFLSFVSKKSIDDFLLVGQDNKKDKLTMVGCSEWFLPDAKNANNESCIAAHTQSPNHGVGAEAGLNAVRQLLQKNATKQLFRTGALINFIFVSDTHDPGRGNSPTLLAKQLKYSEFNTLISKDNPNSGIKFHGLVPQGSSCTSEKMYNHSYIKVIDDSKGVKADPCNTEDYTTLIKNIVIEGSKLKEPIFTLHKPATEILKVFVDGKEIKNFSLSKNKLMLTIPELKDSKTKKAILIYYK